MLVVGNGLIARSLEAYASRHEDVVALAAGVSASKTSDAEEYRREIELLRSEIERARVDDRLLIYFSGGGAVYGSMATPASEQQRLRPVTRYGQHQVICERIVRESGIRYLIVRLPNVVGASANDRQFVPSLVLQVVEGRVVVHSRATRDLIDADDMARIVSELLSEGPARQTVNVASGHSVPVPDIAHAIAAEVGSDPEILHIDAGDAQRFDVSLMRELIGRNPFPDGDYFRGVLAKRVSGIVEALSVA